MLGALTSSVRSRQLIEIPDDAEGGWRIKAAIMRGFSQQDINDLEMQERWQDATKNAKFRDAASEIRAWFAYIQKNVRYTPASFVYDIGSDGQPVPRTQVIIRPAILFRRGLGDCVAMSTAAASGLAIAGYDSDFVFVSTRPDQLPSHVYLRVWYPARAHEKAVVFDATVQQPVGWEVPNRMVTWFAIVPVIQPWDGDGLAPSGVGGSVMGIGRLVVDRNKKGDIVEIAVDRSPFTGRKNDFSYAAWQGAPVPLRSIKYQTAQGGTLSTFAKTTRDLPTVGDADCSVDDAICVHAHRAGLLEEATAKINLAMANQDLRKFGDPNVGGWLQDLGKKAQSAVQAGASAVQHAYTSASTAVTTAANNTYKGAVQAGKSITTAENHALATAKAEAKKASQQFHKLVNKLKLTPLERVLVYLGAGPVGAVAAYKYCQKHQYEVARSLPKWAQDAINNAEKNIGAAFSTGGSVKGLPMLGTVEYRGFGNQSIGGVGFMEAIKQRWNGLSHKTKNEIIAALVVILIITIIICIYASPTLQGWLKAAWELLVAGFKAFFGFLATYWKAIMNWIVGLFSKHGGVPADVAASVPADPTATAADPTATDQQATADEFGSSDDDPSKTSGLVMKAAGSFAASAAIGVAKAFAFR